MYRTKLIKCTAVLAAFLGTYGLYASADRVEFMNSRQELEGLTLTATEASLQFTGAAHEGTDIDTAEGNENLPEITGTIEQDGASSPDTYAQEIEDELLGKEGSSEGENSAEDAKTFDGEHQGLKDGKPYIVIAEEGMDHELTQKFREQFSKGSGKRLLIESIKNSERIRPYIIQKLTENNLPLYLQYLPIVESNYISSAVSRTGATGIWQFMENSMAPMLRKDAWYDERRDPWKSTDAAIAKLQDNYRFFNDWTLAIAAYNCGAGAMQKLLRQNPGKSYWDLVDQNLINKQTGQYVPKLLAIADLVENAVWYDLYDVEEANLAVTQKEVEEFDYVTTTGMLSFNQIAEVTGLEKTEIHDLNLALFRNCTPARETYQLRLPKGYGEDAAEKFKTAGIAKDAVIYTVKSGDTLWGISRRYGISVEDICLVNGINEKSVLSIGKRLIVPIFN